MQVRAVHARMTRGGRDVAAVAGEQIAQVAALEPALPGLARDRERQLGRRRVAARFACAAVIEHDAALDVIAQLAHVARPRPAHQIGHAELVAQPRAARVVGDELAEVERCPLPDPLRLPLVADLIAANVGSLGARRTALGKLLAHGDPRVRAAGLGALAALWKSGDEADHRETIATVVDALGSRDLLVAGAAVDAAKALYEAIGGGDHGVLDAAVIGRATRERDPELGAALLELIGARTLAVGAEACRVAATGDPVRAKAAATCLQALGKTVPVVVPSPASLPPVDVSAVIGKQLRWRVTTSRGDVVILLHPDVAPWAVATIVSLTRKGFYDGLAFHRVVPDFVVQGGDPTESGSGGPGFAIPAEPAALVDGVGYEAGGVGIADAGRDSGGSQWFVMHSRAPHLDGRYTWIGTVESGQNAADALLVGDRVVRATIEPAP